MRVRVVLGHDALCLPGMNAEVSRAALMITTTLNPNQPASNTPGVAVLLLALMAGMLFALGLVVSGMTQPGKVLGFLNLAGMAQGPFPGAWDPGLGFVMGGAVLVTLMAFWITPADPQHPQRKPWLAPRFELPTRTELDARLLTGAALFGIGWGLAGYCPGPALASLFTGGSDVWWFVPAMLAGMWLAQRTSR